jgi:hypothetical protein
MTVDGPFFGTSAKKEKTHMIHMDSMLSKTKNDLIEAGADILTDDLIAIDFGQFGCTSQSPCDAYIIGNSADNWFAEGIFHCRPCYDKFITFLPPIGTFLERHQMIACFGRTGYPQICLMHYEDGLCMPKRALCCDNCRGNHERELAQMAGRYLLLLYMGLPRELAQVIIWFLCRKKS